MGERAAADAEAARSDISLTWSTVGDEALGVEGTIDKESEDDLSPILNALITIPIPQDRAEAKELMRQAFSKRKSAVHKSKIADAALQEALLKARLYRSRAQHAKYVLDAANVYISHVRWTVRRSKHTNVLSKRVDRATAVTDPVVPVMPANHFVHIIGGSMAITLD